MLETAGKDYDFILVQEPYIDFKATTRTNAHYITVYPPRHWDKHNETPTRTVILVNRQIDTNAWTEIAVDWPDITAIELKTEIGKIRIFNIYNSCLHNETLDKLGAYMDEHENRREEGERVHYIWVGDFNRHHPLGRAPQLSSFQQQESRNGAATARPHSTASHEDGAPQDDPDAEGYGDGKPDESGQRVCI